MRTLRAANLMIAQSSGRTISTAEWSQSISPMIGQRYRSDPDMKLAEANRTWIDGIIMVKPCRGSLGHIFRKKYKSSLKYFACGWYTICRRPSGSLRKSLLEYSKRYPNRIINYFGSAYKKIIRSPSIDFVIYMGRSHLLWRKVTRINPLEERYVGLRSEILRQAHLTLSLGCGANFHVDLAHPQFLIGGAQRTTCSACNASQRAIRLELPLELLWANSINPKPSSDQRLFELYWTRK